MATIIKPASGRTFDLTAAVNGIILDLGPGATSSSVGTFIIQFNPDTLSDYEVIVMGRCWGAASAAKNIPFMPIPYRRAVLNNVASDYAIVSDPITGPCMIQVPANWSVGLLVACSVGTCSVVSWDLQGSSNP